jgi:transposase
MENQPLFLLNDDAAARRPILIKDFLTKNNVTALEHPLYCPDLAPDFYLFPRLKSASKGGTDIKMRRKN